MVPPLLLLILLLAGLAALALWSRQSEPPPEEPVFPLPRAYRDAYSNDWGAAREQGRSHEGTDVFAPRGTPIRSISSGTVVSTFGDDGWNNLGGYAVSIRADRDAGPLERGDVLYYAHMDERPALEPGDRVEAGGRIGSVGDTGGGPPGTHGLFEPHLHLGWYDRSYFGSSRAEAPSGAMNPYPLLREVGRGGRATAPS
jgi:collagen type III alpha